MIRRALLASVLGLAVLPALASAGPKLIRNGACSVLTDQTGDVRLDDLAGTEAVNDQHLDVESVYLMSRSNGLDVTIYDVALNANRRGTWTVTFKAGTTTYGVRASLGEWSTAPAHATFSAGVVGRLVAVAGSVDVPTGTITVTVPYRLLGKAGRKGTTLSRFTADADETFADVAAGTVRAHLHDTGTSTKTYRVGASCGPLTGPPPPPPGHAA